MMAITTSTIQEWDKVFTHANTQLLSPRLSGPSALMSMLAYAVSKLKNEPAWGIHNNASLQYLLFRCSDLDDADVRAQAQALQSLLWRQPPYRQLIEQYATDILDVPVDTLEPGQCPLFLIGSDRAAVFERGYFKEMILTEPEGKPSANLPDFAVFGQAPATGIWSNRINTAPIQLLASHPLLKATVLSHLTFDADRFFKALPAGNYRASFAEAFNCTSSNTKLTGANDQHALNELFQPLLQENPSGIATLTPAAAERILTTYLQLDASTSQQDFLWISDEAFQRIGKLTVPPAWH